MRETSMQVHGSRNHRGLRDQDSDGDS